MSTRCLLVSLCAVVAGSLSGIASLSAQEDSVLFESNVKIPMQDGTQLAAHVFRPKADGAYPAILMRTPYGKGDEQQWTGARLCRVRATRW